MNEAIKLAIEGGFKFAPEAINNRSLWPSIILMPEFWQALGNAFIEKDGQNSDWNYILGDPQPPWQRHAHQYFDLILTGGDLDAFWKGLLNEKM